MPAAPSTLLLESEYYASHGPAHRYRLVAVEGEEGTRYRVETWPAGAPEWQLLFRDRLFPAEQVEAERWLRSYVKEKHGSEAELQSTPPDAEAAGFTLRPKRYPPLPYDISNQIAWGVFKGGTLLIVMIMLVTLGLQCLQSTAAMRAGPPTQQPMPPRAGVQ